MITGLSVNYVKSWGVTEALRELLQNAIDAGSPSVLWADGVATIADSGSGITRECWAMGESHKEAGSIGQFGEGLKLALLVLAREGRQVTIDSLDYRLACSIVQTEDYGSASVLSLDFEPSDATTGTIVQVGCSRDELEEAKGYFEALSDVTWIQKPYVSMGHTIYVNGAAIASDDKLSFSYHLNGEQFRPLLNRDRNTIDWPKIEDRFCEFSAFLDIPTLAAIISRFDSKESNFYLAASDNLYRAWVAIYGDKSIIGYSIDTDRFATHSGYRVIQSVPWRWQSALRRSNIFDSADLANQQSSYAEVKVKNEAKLVLTESIRRVKVIWERCDNGGVDFPTIKITKDLIVSGNQANGLYSREDNAVWLRLDRLDSISNCVSTLLHELGHAIGGSDLTDEFQRSLVKLTLAAMRL